MSKRSSEKRLYWQDVLKRQARSGLSIRAFCGQEGVSEPSFYQWRRRLGAAGSGEAATGPSSHGGDSKNGGSFIPLTLLDGASSTEVVHPLGYRIRVTGEVNVASLVRILDVLDRRCVQ